MSYELFRNEIVMKAHGIPAMDEFLRFMDETAKNYDVIRKATDLTVYGSIPDAVRDYIASKMVEGCVNGTLYGYKQTLVMFFAAVRKPIQEVIPNDIRTYLAWYRQTRSVQGSTMDRIRRILYGFFNWCIDEDRIVKNPVKRIEEIHSQKKKLRGLLPLELEHLRNACRNPRERALIEFMFSTGCRVSEVANMKVECLDFRNGTAEVFHGKGDKDRTVFLNAKSVVALQEYLPCRRYDSEYLFNTNRAPGGKMTTHSLRNLVESIASRAADNIRITVTPHTIRRTTATIAHRNGMPIEQIRLMLGHSKMETTMRYIDFDDEEVKRSHGKYVA